MRAAGAAERRAAEAQRAAAAAAEEEDAWRRKAEKADALRAAALDEVEVLRPLKRRAERAEESVATYVGCPLACSLARLLAS